jgi:glycosyltransferase involved in cell wall biosynthesis
MSSFDDKIDIVLATYNGSRYIQEQLDSIISMEQFNEKVNKVIICDDNSVDSTLDIVRNKIPKDKLEILLNENPSPYGPAKNFERGIAASTAQYIMLSDQDDVWNKRKLICYLAEIKNCNPNLPLIIFSDLEVVDLNLMPIASSFLSYQSIDKTWHNRLENLLVQNVAPGCTMMFNRNLIEKAFPFPENCLMHDWWLMLVCKTFGEIKFIDSQKFIKYRQHGNNQVGAKSQNILVGLRDFKQNLNVSRNNFLRTVQQINSFKLRYSKNLSSDTLQFIDTLLLYMNPDISRIKRLVKGIQVKLKKSSTLKTFITYYIFINGLKK